MENLHHLDGLRADCANRVTAAAIAVGQAHIARTEAQAQEAREARTAILEERTRPIVAVETDIED